MKDIKVGDKVLVCGELKTTIIRIEGNKYYFMDGDKEWSETKDAIEVIESIQQINSKTNCPTCGSEVTIGGEGPTHFYIPKVIPDKEKLANFFEQSDKFYTEEEVKDLLIKHRETLTMNAFYNEQYGSVEIDIDENDWFNKHKKK